MGCSITCTLISMAFTASARRLMSVRRRWRAPLQVSGSSIPPHILDFTLRMAWNFVYASVIVPVLDDPPILLLAQ